MLNNNYTILCKISQIEEQESDKKIRKIGKTIDIPELVDYYTSISKIGRRS